MSTINILEPSVQIREKRLGTINAFTGSASEIVQRSEEGSLKDAKRKFSQCLGCNAQQAFCQLSMIKDVAADFTNSQLLSMLACASCRVCSVEAANFSPMPSRAFS